jgi:hypothetical protein
MELLAGFALLIGSNFLSATSLQYGMLPLLLGGGVIGIAISSLVCGLVLPERWGKIVLMAGAAATALLPAFWLVHSFSPRASVALLLAVSYRRGMKLGEDPPDYGDVQHSFSLGFALLLVSIIWMIARGLVSQSPTWAGVAVTAVLYMVVALIALAVARIDAVRAGGVGNTIVFSVGMQVAFLLLISLGAIELFSLDLASTLGHLTQPFWNVVGGVLLGVMKFVLTPVINLATFVHLHAKVGHPRPRRPFFGLPRRHLVQVQHADTTWLKVLGISIASLASVAVLLLIWHTLPEAGRREAKKRKKSRSRLWYPRGFWSAFLSWARSLLRGGVGMVAERAAIAKRRMLGPTYPANPVRRVYAQLLARSSKQGLSRQTAKTPAEFLTQLEMTWPEGSQHFVALTKAYILCRYGEANFQDEQIAQLKEHWRAVRSIMRGQAERPRGWLQNPLGGR